MNSQIKFLCLTETWAKDDTIEHLRFDNFYLGSYYCRKNNKGGGVAIWVNNEVNVKVIDVGRFCVEKSIEICAIKVSLNNNSLIIVNCYRSPSGDMNVFLYNMNGVLNYLYKPNINFILCGDVNVDGCIVDGLASKEFRMLCNVTSSFNLLPIVNWPTRVTDASATIIDNIFTNIDCTEKCIVVDNIISDHRTILLQSNLLSSNKNQNQPFFYERRIFSESLMSRFLADLSNHNWNTLYFLDDIDKAFNSFFDIFHQKFNNHFPVTKCYKKADDGKKWVTPEVRFSSTALRDLHNLSRCNPSLKESYKTAKKIHKNLVETTKREYYQLKIFSSDNPGKMAWNVISDLSGKSSKVNDSNFKIIHKENILEDPQDIANLFNQFFIDIPNKILDQINNIPNINNINQCTINENTSSFFLSPMCEEDILRIINCKLKNKWSAGMDDVPVCLLKKIGIAIVRPLVYLVNLSFLSGKFPNILKDRTNL